MTHRWHDKNDWQRLHDDFARRPLRAVTLLLFCMDLGCVAFSWLVHTRGGIGGMFAGWALLTFAMIQLYLVLHEAAHSAVSRKKLLNNLVGNVCGWSFGLPFFTRQRNHLMHHVWAAHPSGDPENAKMIEKMAVMTVEEERKIEFIWRNWLPVIAVNHIVATWRGPFAERRAGNRSARFDREMRWQRIYACGYVALAALLIATGELGAFLSWYLPPWIVLLMAIELLNLPHHAEAPLLRPDAKPLPYWRQAEVSHNCAALPVWSSFVIMSFNLHIVHHEFPMVPWYRLRALNRRSEALARSATPGFKNEFEWAVVNRRRPILQVMGHFFDKRVTPGPPKEWGVAR